MAAPIIKFAPRPTVGGLRRREPRPGTPGWTGRASTRTLAAILIAVCAAGTACGHPDAPQQKTLSLYEHDTQQASLDLGSRGDGPGDVFVFAGDLFDHQGGTKLGRAGGHATTTSGDPTKPGELLFTVTLSLAGGQIETQGLYDSSALFGGQTLPIAVTGGTGEYRDARGDATVQVPPTCPTRPTPTSCSPSTDRVRGGTATVGAGELRTVTIPFAALEGTARLLARPGPLASPTGCPAQP